MKAMTSIRGLWLLLVLAFARPGVAADWTVMIYMDGDNTLEAAAIDDFLEIAGAGSTSAVNVVALFDRIPPQVPPIDGGSAAYGNWTDTRRGVIAPGNLPDLTWGTSLGELNMGDPTNLVNFVEWGMQNYPATRYAVVLWDHGGGWRKRAPNSGEDPPFKDVCQDVTDRDILFMKEVRQALGKIEEDIQAPDLLGFDACLMSMAEVAYEVRDHASVMVGSEKKIPNDGWPYDLILSDLIAQPGMTPAQLGQAIVDRYYQFYGNGQILASIDLSWAATVKERVHTLAHALRTAWNSNPGSCAVAASRVIQAVDAAVLHEHHDSVAWSNSHGLAIYFPKTSNANFSAYNDTNILFAGTNDWDEFLVEYYAHMNGSWVYNARELTQNYDNPGHVDLIDFCEKIMAQAPDVVWVDYVYAGVESGTFDQPFNTTAEAVAAVGEGNIIFIKAGSTPAGITIGKPLIMRSSGGAAIVGQ